MLGLEGHEVLADRDRRDAELSGQIADPGASVLLDDAGDVLLPFAGEDVARGGAGGTGHASPRSPGGQNGGLRLVADAQ